MKRVGTFVRGRRVEARLAVGGLAQLREEYRDALGFRPLDEARNDPELGEGSARPVYPMPMERYNPGSLFRVNRNVSPSD